ncbi:MAG: hypothetical protein HY703_00705 [Gemmatimonadetes bacterium]|nr:hypothetical protein [Gemmatimonadota bacterium]
MTRRAWRSLLGALALVLAGGGCAGEGTGLDEFGNPRTGPARQLGPTLGSIQALVFSPICTRCHTGASAPLGLALDPGVAHGNLVGVHSVERPDLMRVRPGEPDSSYLLWKLEGRPGIEGSRMPLGSPPLTPEQLAAIRDWIAAGAANN